MIIKLKIIVIIIIIINIIINIIIIILYNYNYNNNKLFYMNTDLLATLLKKFSSYEIRRSKKGKAKKIYEMLFTITYWFSILSNLILEI